jgi:diacylglycerol kinase family enzyme
VKYLRGSTVSVSGQDFYCSADGEVYGPERQRTWRMEPGALRMVLPR